MVDRATDDDFDRDEEDGDLDNESAWLEAQKAADKVIESLKNTYSSRPAPEYKGPEEGSLDWVIQQKLGGYDPEKILMELSLLSRKAGTGFQPLLKELAEAGFPTIVAASVSLRSGDLPEKITNISEQEATSLLLKAFEAESKRKPELEEKNKPFIEALKKLVPPDTEAPNQ